MPKVRVAQCWDDGVATDARLVEILRRYKAKATFNLCPGIFRPGRVRPSWQTGDMPGWSHKGFLGGRIGLDELTEVYGGFQVASHCMAHEVATAEPLEKFVRGAVDARKFLEDLFQQECRGFAWPCGAHTPEAVMALREAGFAYGRTTANSATVLPCEEPLLLAPSCHFQDWRFWQIFEEAKRSGGVFYFWGHSYEMFEYAPLWARTEEKIALLSADPDVEWVDVIDLVGRKTK